MAFTWPSFHASSSQRTAIINPMATAAPSVSPPSPSFITGHNPFLASYSLPLFISWLIFLSIFYYHLFNVLVLEQPQGSLEDTRIFQIKINLNLGRF
jgi:hypothetical protein